MLHSNIIIYVEYLLLKSNGSMYVTTRGVHCKWNIMIMDNRIFIPSKILLLEVF